jgi:hypothetical protein
MYVSSNPKSLAELKRQLKAGKSLTVYAPGLGDVPYNGECSIEGPHAPRPHTWYATAVIKDGKLVKVK